jgi:hypothetical protein
VKWTILPSSCAGLFGPIVVLLHIIAVRLPVPDIPTWNSFLLALSSDLQRLIVRSQLGLQERALQWLGKWSAMIRNIQQQIVTCVLVSGQYTLSLCTFGEAENLFQQN